MKGLKYLLFTTFKNFLKELLKNPAKLISVIIFIALIVLVIFSASFNDKLPSHTTRNIEELYGIVFALYSYIFIATCMNGLSSGASFYSMADVSILFSTPISNKKILIYGLMKQMGTSLLVGFFLIFQYAWLNSTYGLSFGGLLGILLGYCFIMFCSQLSAMVIYSFSSNDENLQRKIKISLIGITSLIIFYVFYKTISNSQDMLNTAVEAINSFWINFIPIVGWIKMAVIGILNSNYYYILIGFSLTLLYIFIIVYLITKTRSDFYEDVLLATEVSHSAIIAKKEGNILDTRKNVKVGKIGINKGKGANVFLYKHLLENKRSGLLLIDKTSLMFIVICIVYALITNNMFSEYNILSIFIFVTYMQIFSLSNGRWIRELRMHYVYMIPIKPFLKLIKISLENILKITIEATILFIGLGMILGLSPIEIIGCIFARIGFGILFMSGNILTQRLLGSLFNKVIIMFLYILIMILLAAPGIVIGVITSSSISILPPIIAGLFITFIWNILISSLVIYFCRDILNYAELNDR